MTDDCLSSLYRSGYLQVVIATGTLAIGINAPEVDDLKYGSFRELVENEHQVETVPQRTRPALETESHASGVTTSFADLCARECLSR